MRWLLAAVVGFLLAVLIAVYVSVTLGVIAMFVIPPVLAGFVNQLPERGAHGRTAGTTE